MANVTNAAPESPRHARRRRILPDGLPVGRSVALLLAASACMACIGSRFKTEKPGTDLDPVTRVIVDRIASDRAQRGLSAPELVPELGPPVVRAALAVARGEQSLKTAAHFAAQQAVTEVGRHVWSFAAECADARDYRPPPLAFDQKVLMMGAAAAPKTGGQTGGQTVVLLVIAEPGASALRADQMGGGPGGTNRSLEAYAHPSVATAPCGHAWPAAQRTPL